MEDFNEEISFLEDLEATQKALQGRFKNQIDLNRINQLVELGYSEDYVIETMEKNEANYCSAGYYLLGMNQNYC